MGNWEKTGTLSREIHLTVVASTKNSYPISGPAPYKYSITYSDNEAEDTEKPVD